MAYIAPHSPVADWRCVPEGVGYGNYFDPVSGTWATVTRATPKTARTADGRIVDVPAGKLALEPWSLHKAGGVGHAAVIEEERTNYLLNSYGADGVTTWTSWGFHGTHTARQYSKPTGSVYGYAHRCVMPAGEVGGNAYMQQSMSGFSSGESVTLSEYVTERDVGSFAVGSSIFAYAPASVFLGRVDAHITSMRHTSTYASLPVGTAEVRVWAYTLYCPAGASAAIAVEAVQLEKGSFATSYIPTTTAAATRNADVPVGVDASVGTQVIVRSGANLATPAAVSTFTGDPAAAMLNRAVQRIALYDAALSAEQLAAADMTTDLLAGLDTARITNEVTL